MKECIGIFPAFGGDCGERRNPLKKMFLSENVIFRGLRLSLDPFGQQAPESPVSQLQNGVSTSPLPPFIVDLLTFKDCLFRQYSRPQGRIKHSQNSLKRINKIDD